jgi:hypothetical protein
MWKDITLTNTPTTKKKVPCDAKIGPPYHANTQRFRTKTKLWFNLHGIILEGKPIGLNQI